MTDYEQMAEDFLKKANTTMIINPIETVTGFPFDEKDTNFHTHYEITLIGGRSQKHGSQYAFDFYDSYYNWLHNIEPSEYNVLASLITYDVGSMANFVDDFGYVIKDRESFLRVENAWKTCKEQYESLLNFFGPEDFEKLQEIN